ncbi:MAG: hypothetical protein K9W44_08575 [Candidatus Lokiarchaeota archaeon]|nr:hypothetical protein [Candidatus Harpocratesius repetitus]
MHYIKSKIIALQSGRLVKEFKDLLDSKWNEFEKKERRLLKIYSDSPYLIAKKLAKLFQIRKRCLTIKLREFKAWFHPIELTPTQLNQFLADIDFFLKNIEK